MTSKIYGDICDGCYAKNFCDMAQFGGHNPRITACSKFKKGKQTNADKIRAMTDEELANTLSWLNDSKTADEWLDWLQKEAEDG